MKKSLSDWLDQLNQQELDELLGDWPEEPLPGKKAARIKKLYVLKVCLLYFLVCIVFMN